ncbi:hypothetical protein DS909_05610 [Phaeobacter gallaeciensis]|uniref:Uncharacterized protein n=1 Tax=Phaeobacter gallaeciensis TaxID=60890 RepID=A0A366X5X3_9RHOB|nr:hypothetical protein [Phaeobacter gallaeciensis]RBW58442.1 hypothetical protein DS909_05610 [Phaeobacter gallaeciensis]
MNVSFTELEQSKLHAAMATAMGVVEGHPCCTQNIARHAFAEVVAQRTGLIRPYLDLAVEVEVEDVVDEMACAVPTCIVLEVYAHTGLDCGLLMRLNGFYEREGFFTNYYGDEFYRGSHEVEFVSEGTLYAYFERREDGHSSQSGPPVAELFYKRKLGSNVLEPVGGIA